MKKNEHLSNDRLARFFLELSLLVHAGVTAADGVSLLNDQSGAEEPFLQTAVRALDSGEPLSQSLRQAGGFPEYALGLISVGERTGRMEEALRALSTYYDGCGRLSCRLRSALLYPALMALLMLVVIGVLLIRVLPVFDQVFASLGGGLSGAAGVLLRLGQALDGALPLLCVLLAAAALFLTAFAVSEAFRERVLQAWCRRRGERGLCRKLADARFAQALAMCLRSGLDTASAVETAGSLDAGNAAATERVRRCLEALHGGTDLAAALEQTELLPAAECRMLALGFRGGVGDTVMEEIAARMGEDTEQRIDALVGRVEPALVIGASVVVGAILLSVMLPMMNIMAALG